MPRINLLPVKAKRRALGARQELTMMAGLFVFTLAGLYAWYAATQTSINDMVSQVQQLQTDVKQLENAVQQVEEFKKKSLILERKLGVIDVLKRQKTGPSHMLSDLADILTSQRRVWLMSLEEKNGTLTLKGGAMQQENIAEFEMAMEKQSKYFRDVTLNLVTSAKEGGMSYFMFTIVCRTDYAAG